MEGGKRHSSKDKLAILNENWKAVKDKMMIYFNFSWKPSKTLIVNSIPGNSTPTDHQKRYKDEVIMMFEIMSKETQEGKKKGDNCWTIAYWLNKLQFIGSVEHYIVIKTILCLYLSTQWYIKWKKKSK